MLFLLEQLIMWEMSLYHLYLLPVCRVLFVCLGFFKLFIKKYEDFPGVKFGLVKTVMAYSVRNTILYRTPLSFQFKFFSLELFFLDSVKSMPW